MRVREIETSREAKEIALEALMAAPQGVFDFETCKKSFPNVGYPTVNYRDCDVVLSSFYTGEEEVFVLHGDLYKELRPWFESEDHAKIGHNFYYDINVLTHTTGWALRGKKFETMYMYWLTDGQYGDNKEELGLETIAERHYNVKFSKFSDVWGQHREGRTLTYPSMWDVVYNENSPFYNREKAIWYSAEDVYADWFLFKDVERILKAFDLWDLYVNNAMIFQELLNDMTENGGIALNLAVFQEIYEITQKQYMRADHLFRQRTHPHANQNSTPQKQHIFFQHGLYKAKTGHFSKKPDLLDCGCPQPHIVDPKAYGHLTKTKAPSTSYARMKQLAEQEGCAAAKVLEMQGSVKTISDFATRIIHQSEYEKTILPDGSEHLYKVLRPNWWAMLTTGRVSTGSNNIEIPVFARPEKKKKSKTYNYGTSVQNIPSNPEKDPYKIRRGFVARPGHVLVVADYDQLELRILANLTLDPLWLKIFDEGIDPHSLMAVRAFRLDCEWHEVKKKYKPYRSKTKAVNYGIVYGLGEKSLAGQTGMTVDEARDLIQRWYEEAPYVKAYIDECHWFAARYGYVHTMDGRRRYLPNVSAYLNAHSGKPVDWRNPKSLKHIHRSDMNRAANTPIQGHAGDVMRKAQVNLYKDPRTKKLISAQFQRMQIHDELVCEARIEHAEEACALLSYHMENAVKLRVPYTASASYGYAWSDCK